MLDSKLSITDPRLTQTAVAWTSSSFGPDGVTLNGAYNYIDTGTDLLVINVDATTTSAAFFGPAAGASKGNAVFYKAVQVVGTLKVGSVNIIDELATKLSLSSLSTSSIPQLLFNANLGAPTLTTRSIGSKIVLFPSITSSMGDYAIGAENNSVWLSVSGLASATNGFKYYLNNTNIATICSYGDFTCNGGVTCSSLTVGTQNSKTELSLKTDRSTTDNSAVAWSSGSASAYHYLKTGTESLIVSTPNNTNAMEIAGTSIGLANEGKI